jgi:hypothetical protein
MKTKPFVSRPKLVELLSTVHDLFRLKRNRRRFVPAVEHLEDRITPSHATKLGLHGLGFEGIFADPFDGLLGEPHEPALPHAGGGGGHERWPEMGGGGSGQGDSGVMGGGGGNNNQFANAGAPTGGGSGKQGSSQPASPPTAPVRIGLPPSHQTTHTTHFPARKSKHAKIIPRKNSFLHKKSQKKGLSKDRGDRGKICLHLIEARRPQGSVQ